MQRARELPPAVRGAAESEGVEAGREEREGRRAQRWRGCVGTSYGGEVREEDHLHRWWGKEREATLAGTLLGQPAAVLSFQSLPTVLANLRGKGKNQPGPRTAHAPALHNRAFGWLLDRPS